MSSIENLNKTILPGINKLLQQLDSIKKQNQKSERRVQVLSIDEITKEIIKPNIESLQPQRYPLMTEKATVKPYAMHKKP